MNRDEFHYSLTAALAAEATLARTSSREKAYAEGLLVGRVDGMVDWLTPGHLAATWGLPLATQVRVGEGAAAQLCGGFWPIMARVHRFHFAAGLLPSLPEQIPGEDRGPTLTRFAVALHRYQDAGEPGCPHWNYVGYPSRMNWNRSDKLGVIGAWERGLAWVRPSLRGQVWGHVLDPGADDIGRCRKGALETSIVAWEAIAGGRVQWELGESGKLPSLPHRQEIGLVRIESLIAIMEAKDDRDLEARSRRIFRDVTGRELPTFTPFVPASEEWNTLMEATR